jgi:hypothetical protein
MCKSCIRFFCFTDFVLLCAYFVLVMFFFFLARSELAEYWQKIIGIDKVTEFNKHHCNQDLKSFLDVDENLKKVSKILFYWEPLDSYD